MPTLKEDPQDAEAISHKLMVRAGIIRRLTAGAYIYLPLGYKILKKAEGIIREEMAKAGAIELLMPALQPVELWKKTGRYDVIGDVMIKFTDRHGRETALGPTHEEVVTSLVAREVRSYKDLPLTLYQIQTKFRDEVRPRFGVVRSCEFIMKDAYSFDTGEEGLEENYKKMYAAYCRIFERCGIGYVPVEADTGMMGGAGSHEFMVPCEIGEDRIVNCPSCGYSASTEVAAVAGTFVPGPSTGEASPVMEEVDTPGVSTVEAVSGLLKVGPEAVIKTLIYMAEDEPVAVLVRGDHEANEAKIKKYLGVVRLELADERKIFEVTGGPVGFSGPVGNISARIIGDNSVKSLTMAVTGANKKDRHLTGVVPGRDFNVGEWADLRNITEEDKCPRCGADINIKNAIEIGHTFKLGTKYSEPLEARYLDSDGKENTIVMGCYGIGVNRILASLVETSYDKDGIIWPVALSPYEVVVIPVKRDDEELMREAEAIYDALISAGIDAILDDRDRSPGIKFKDADLIGFPYQVVVGRKALDQGKVELKERAGGIKTLVDRDKIAGQVEDAVKAGRGK